MRKIFTTFFLTGFLVTWGLLSSSLLLAAEEDIEYRFERLWPRLEKPWYFNRPSDVAIASDGSVYIADSGHGLIQQFSAQGDFIRKWNAVAKSIALTADGSVYASSGYSVQLYSAQGDLIRTWGTDGSDDGEFDDAHGIAIAPDGSVYIADTGNNRIQQFSAQGDFIRTWGSRPASIFGLNDGEFNWPVGVAVASDGSVYVTDQVDDRIQQFSAQGDFIRTWGSRGSGNGELQYPQDIEIASDGSIYVAEVNNGRIQQFSAQGDFIRTLGTIGEDRGKSQSPAGIAIASDGSIYIAEWSNSIQHISGQGDFIQSWGSRGSGEGQFDNPEGMATATDGSVYVVERFNDRVQQFSDQGAFIRAWGGSGSGDGELGGPKDIATAPDGSVYIADTGNQRIQKFSAQGEFIRKWGSEGTGDGEFIRPQGIAISSNGDVYVVESGNRRIQQFSAQGDFIRKWKVLIDPWQFNYLSGIAIAPDGSVFVTEARKQRIEQYSAEGELIRRWEYFGTGEGQFVFPVGIAIDSDGSVFITASDRIHQFSVEGDFIRTLENSGSGDGQVRQPTGITIGTDGSIYVAELGNHRIQKFAPKNKATTKHPYKAVILAGGGEKIGGRINHIWDGTWRVTQKAYKALSRQAFVIHDEIKFLTAGSTQFDLDNNNKFDDLEKASKESLRRAITEWAADANDVVIFLANHGGPGKFQVNSSEILTGEELNSWVSELDDSIPGKVTVIIEACNSASFFKQLSQSKRNLFASAKADQPAVISNDGLSSFSYFLWSEIGTGALLKDAFETARQAMSPIIIDGLAQNAQADTNGDRQFTRQDLEGLGDYCLGNCNQTAAAAPVIAPIKPSSQTLNGETALDFSIKVDHLQALNRVWALVQRPDDISIDPNQALNFESIKLTCNKQDICQGRYEKFDLIGEYRVSFYAMDDQYEVSFPEVMTINQTQGKSVIPAVYDDQLAVVYLRDVIVDGLHLQAALELQGGKFVVIAFSEALKEYTPAAQFDTKSGLLTVPHALAFGSDYQATFKYLGNLEFELLSAIPK